MNCGSEFAYVYSSEENTYVYNYNDLENCMSLASHTSNAAIMRLKIFALLY